MSKKKKILIGVLVVIVILLLLWGYKTFMKKETPAELEKKAEELRAQNAGTKYSSFMNQVASGVR